MPNRAGWVWGAIRAQVDFGPSRAGQLFSAQDKPRPLRPTRAATRTRQDLDPGVPNRAGQLWAIKHGRARAAARAGQDKPRRLSAQTGLVHFGLGRPGLSAQTGLVNFGLGRPGLSAQQGWSILGH